MFPNDTPKLDIPYGYCHCGCGQLAPICTHTDKRCGAKKGEPRRFISNHHPKRPTSPHHFWSRVDKSGGEDACWPWTGALSSDGYGNTKWHGKSELSHRIAYFLTYGAFDETLKVCHNCPSGDNPACCNPAHLWLGTQGDNVRDMWAKGRDNHPWGEHHPEAKLTWKQVDEIRERGRVPYLGLKIELAREYHVDASVIHDILAGTAWKLR